jgi:branched-chain amino acid transport system permease protein
MDSFAQFLQQLVNGLSIGAIYALIAVGYTMVYGILRLINFAHGDVYMFGAMVGLYVATGRMDFLAAPLWVHPLVWGAIAGAAMLAGWGLKVPSVFRWARVLGFVCVALVAISLSTRAVAAVGLPTWTGFALVMFSATLACGTVGMLIEMLAYRPLRGRPRIESLITAIGISLFLMAGGQAVFGATPQSFPPVIPGMEQNPNLISIAMGTNAAGVPITVTISKINALILGVTLTLMLILRYIVLHTRGGLALRAVSFRFDTASLMGIDVNRTVSFTFILGSVLAASGGVLIALSAPRVEPLMGLMMGLKAFVAAVLGGIGSIPGAVAGGLLLGVVETLVTGYVDGGSQYRDGVAFVILIGVLLLRPSGLFGEKAIEKV